MPETKVKRDKQKVIIFEDGDAFNVLELSIGEAADVGFIVDRNNARAWRFENDLVLPGFEKTVKAKDKDGSVKETIADEKRGVLLLSARNVVPLDPFGLKDAEALKALQDMSAIATAKQNEATEKSGKKSGSFLDSVWFGVTMSALAIGTLLAMFRR